MAEVISPANHPYVDDEVFRAVTEGWEIWRAIPGYEGKYEASSFGGIRSLPRQVHCRAWKLRSLPGRALKPYPNPVTGYTSVKLFHKETPKVVHRLIAKALLAPDAGRGFVNHKNGAKDDNRVVNLEWVTDSENKRHMQVVLRKNIGERNAFSRLTQDDVDDIIVLHAFGARIHHLAKMFGVTDCPIRKIIKGITWREHRGLRTTYKKA